MSDSTHRYRITVTPVGSDGLQSPGRCTIEFQHACQHDWMRILEAMQRLRGFSGDERAALSMATQLLSGLMVAHRADADDLFAPLRPHLGEFIETLERRNGVV